MNLIYYFVHAPPSNPPTARIITCSSQLMVCLKCDSFRYALAITGFAMVEVIQVNIFYWVRNMPLYGYTLILRHMFRYIPLLSRPLSENWEHRTYATKCYRNMVMLNTI